MTDVLIIGGGIMGMLTAKELLKKGARVTLLDKSELGSEASWAGGGIVSPLYPWTYSDAITKLADWAQKAYPNLAEELLDCTGIDPEFNPCGLLMLEPDQMQVAEDWAHLHHKKVARLGSQEVREREPRVTMSCEKNLFLPYVGNIRNPRLLKSLRAYLQSHKGFQSVTHCEVIGLTKRGASVEVQSTSNQFSAEKVVICSGAWSQRLLTQLAVSSGVRVQPVKGQMLVFAPVPGLINSIVMHQGKYLIPRLDGRIVMGSTLEHSGFDKSTTQEARQQLLARAFEMVSELQGVQVEAHWAGLRPGSAAGVPFIGALPGWDNLFINAGHYRNGLVLAPASAGLVSAIVLGETPPVDPSPYDPAAEREPAPMH